MSALYFIDRSDFSSFTGRYIHTFKMSPSIPTRILVFSDTHGAQYGTGGWQKPRFRADVAIHCGDLTEESKINEFKSTLELLRNTDADLKLVIAGNHDFTLDTAAFDRKVAELQRLHPLENLQALVQREYGKPGEARQILEAARAEHNIVLIDEGVHRFHLNNGAQLTVYASPYTPGDSGWGFTYDANQSHDFDIPPEVDVVVTHGPPHGIMDYTADRTRAGCPGLFAAVAKARPLLHCFGHIHTGWGAKKVAWRPKLSINPSHFTDIDNGKSPVLKNLSHLRRGQFDSDEIWAEKQKTLKQCIEEGCTRALCSAAGPHPLVPKEETLFVNAAIESPEGEPTQFPWLVEIDLPAQML
jgi:Icc-related predicted phosphoesterase